MGYGSGSWRRRLLSLCSAARTMARCPPTSRCADAAQSGGLPRRPSIRPMSSSLVPPGQLRRDMAASSLAPRWGQHIADAGARARLGGGERPNGRLAGRGTRRAALAPRMKKAASPQLAVERGRPRDFKTASPCSTMCRRHSLVHCTCAWHLESCAYDVGVCRRWRGGKRFVRLASSRCQRRYTGTSWVIDWCASA